LVKAGVLPKSVSYGVTEELMGQGKLAMTIGVPALISLYETMAKDSALLRQLKAGVEQGQIMPNIPQMGRFFSALGTALQIATEDHASPEAAAREAEAVIREK
jgi:maltose/maltodextrin transport system substrate-binding protein